MNNEVNHFFGCEDLPAVKAKYKKLAAVLHPDKPTGNEDRFKMMAAEYDRVQREAIFPVPRKGEFERQHVASGWTQADFEADLKFWQDLQRRQQQSQYAGANAGQSRRRNPYSSGEAKYHDPNRFDPKQFYQWFDSQSAQAIHGDYKITLKYQNTFFNEEQANRAIRHAYTIYGAAMSKEQLREVLDSAVKARESAVKLDEGSPAEDLIDRKRREAKLYDEGKGDKAREMQQRAHQYPLTPDECLDPNGDINAQLNKMNKANPDSHFKPLTPEEQTKKGFTLGALIDKLNGL